MALAFAHPFVIIPVVGQVPDDGGCPGRHFTIRGKGVRLFSAIAMHTGRYMIFIKGSIAHPGYEAFPNSRIAARLKLEAFLLPSVEVTHDVNLFGIWRPYGEVSAVFAIYTGRMCAESII